MDLRRALCLLVSFMFAAATTPAMALETSFHTYDGFSETVSAFRLVSTIFSDPRYGTLVVIIAVAGMAIGAALAAIRGSGMGIVAFGFQMLAGIGLFVGLVGTTGTVHVYDRVRNAYQSVGDVPNLIVLVAGVTNMMERALAETIDDATLDPNAKLEFGAGGHAFDLFLNAVSPRGPMTDSFLDATIKDYVRQCYPVARVSSAYGVDDDQLFRNTTDLPAAFAAMAGPSTFSTVFSAADKAGTTVSCDEAWQHIADRLNDPAIFKDYSLRLCAASGYATDDATQLGRCRSNLGSLGSMMMDNPMPMQTFLTDVLLGVSVGDVLFEDSPATAARVMANRAVVSSGFSTLSTANEWMPTIRATVFGIMLFMMPVALLFILTPINLRVASFALGLFVFVALWGVIDAGLYQLTLGRAMDALAEMRSFHVAANAWILAPSSAMKALAIFGTFRSASAALASAFVFTVFRFSGNVFSGLTSGSLAVQNQAAGAGAGVSTSEGYASALESQASAAGTSARRGVSSRFGDFGERSSFGANRNFGAAERIIGEGSGTANSTAFGLGATDGARDLGNIAPALAGRDLSDPAVARDVQAAATTGAVHNFAEKDALRSLGTSYFGQGPGGERAFAAFSQNLIQWKAFGDTQAYGMMMQGATRHFERSGYSQDDAELKASGLVAQASSDPTFAKLIANSYDEEAMLRNDVTGAQIQVGAMEGRRDYAGDEVSRTERHNVATEQGRRTGTNSGQREAAAMLGLSVDETSRRIGFIDALSGEARSTAISQLARSTGRNEAQVEGALARYRAASDVGTADGAIAEASREGTSVYGRTREAAGYDFAERSGKLDAQREIGHDGTRSAAHIGEQRRQSEQFGFAEGGAAAGLSTREAARLDSFIQALSQTAGNQVDMKEGGAEGIADRARNARLTSVVDRERLSRVQGLLRAHGIQLSKREIAMDQNGDFGLNLTPGTASQLWRAGLINESQLGTIANGGHARFSFAHNDLLVSSRTQYEKAGQNDTSTRFEAGKQAGPDTIEHFMSGGVEGREAMANWLRGGFEMDRKGAWRLKPQVADTLQRDITAIIAQTGWTKSINRIAQDQTTLSFDAGLHIGGNSTSTSGSPLGTGGRGNSGQAGGSIGLGSTDSTSMSEDAHASLDVVNYDVRGVLSASEGAASQSPDPARTFSEELGGRIMGPDGLRQRYLRDAAAGRSTLDILSPLTSLEQESLLKSGRSYLDRPDGPGDGHHTDH